MGSFNNYCNILVCTRIHERTIAREPEPTLLPQDCLHLQLYRDSKDRYKQGQTKASLSLQHFLGVETGFTLDKESNTIAILCQDVTVVLAFDTRERLIQWQVKIANNLGEDLQYLIQIGSAPARTKISAGPARLHIQEYRFSLTMGVPPRLIGVWNISQLRRYGVVENRFCFEGGSACGRLEGVYVLVTDQGDEITASFRAASEGKLIPRRKQVIRNMSVMESPVRRHPPRLKTAVSTDGSEQTRLSSTIWEQSLGNSEFGDTVSVTDLTTESQTSCDGWSNSSGAGRCGGCNSAKLGNMTRSLTVSNTPGTGFNPAWIMEATGCEHGTTRSAGCCSTVVGSDQVFNSDSTCRAASPTGHVPPCQLHGEPRTHKCQSLVEPLHYENYDTPRSICASLKEEPNQPNRMSLASSSDEYYDTPRKIKESMNTSQCRHRHHAPPATVHHCLCHSAAIQPACRHSCLAHQPVCQPCHNVQRFECSCHMVRICSCQQQPMCHSTKQVPAACSCSHEDKPGTHTSVAQVVIASESSPNGAIYAKVDLLKKTKRKMANGNPETSPKSCPVPKMEPPIKDSAGVITVPNYANIGFARSLEHYENVRDLKGKLGCGQCQCQNTTTFSGSTALSPNNSDYLFMGPVPHYVADEAQQSALINSGGPPYISMNPIVKCQCSEPYAEPVSTQPRSATASPYLRRHDPASCYATNERRRLAQIRRRSNSMDSGRYLEGLECITERTTSSSTHNTLTPNSQSNSIDSLPSEKSQENTPKKTLPQLLLEQEVSRRPSSVPCNKSNTNRDSSSSNDSGVSTGSLKNFGAGFLEFETIITPLSKVRQKSLEGVPLRLPRRSKSSEPLEELCFRLGKGEVKSSSAEAEVPICPPKKEGTKDLSVSSSSGTLTIPYIDSISSSSGASDMSDYFETLSMSSYSSSEHDNLLRQSHSAVTILRPRSGKEYQKIDRSALDYGKSKLSGAQHSDSPSPGYISSTSSN
ncbi:uncharacterized protein isoform X3 [Rhodnius prolixus]|uniref:uncharacterized protein isoform X3 n=1 Tax=Rhodnius prolixus TaxID=13249 RepID=UPI003D18987B